MCEAKSTRLGFCAVVAIVAIFFPPSWNILVIFYSSSGSEVGSTSSALGLGDTRWLCTVQIHV